MATQDPIRVAEETAILDHITRGRYFVGFARGYQSRWTNTPWAVHRNPRNAFRRQQRRRA
jgi:alkanesulfonate monooxygenase SsuD/methylene tetrahydromethanopterin reductase-like flavin-dependent oxidoreductase (luciferase family)